MHTRAQELLKVGTAKHKGIFFYINRNKRLGINPPKKSGLELAKAKKNIKIARKKAKARGKG